MLKVYEIHIITMQNILFPNVFPKHVFFLLVIQNGLIIIELVQTSTDFYTRCIIFFIEYT